MSEQSEKPQKLEDQNFSFPQMERKILNFWQENEIFKKSLEKTRGKRPYIFYDGPPFATGLPHHGHLTGSTLKDIVPRYWTMKGRYVERRFGWDCHGLPIEHEIDKKLGLSAQDAVAKLGVAGYNNECRSIVDRYVEEWEKTITRIGRWVDFRNDYKTMDASFMESVWWVFKQLWDKGLIYQGTKVVPYSTALGTALSNFEAGQNYQDVQDPAITVLFKLKDEDAYLTAWTTTPWTLPSNLGLCVGPDIDYVCVRDEEKNISFYIAKERLEAYGKKRTLTVIKEIKGSELKGLRYEPLFPYFSHFESEGAFQVHADGYVTTEAGTGIVHLAPAFGEDDNRVMKEAGLAEVFALPIDQSGRFDQQTPDLKGQYVKDADKAITKALKEKGLLYEQSTIVHSYPFCYRSDTPLIYKAIPSWYVRVEELKGKLLKSNSEINWIPGHLQEGRFGKWLEGARDWSISRNRVWGTPLPVWMNDETGEKICVGSIAELKEISGIEVSDLHREFIDPITFSLKGKPGVFRRIEEVLDCWFESGSMPYAQLHYPFENQEIFKEGFPAEFIAEGLDQTRGWFYTLTVLSTALFEKPAFKNVIVNGIVMAEDGKKMSKRLKNYTPPDDLMEEYGADALRLYLINSGLVKAEESRFSDNGVKEMVRKALLPWFNSFKFFSTYAQIDHWKIAKDPRPSSNILDQWVLSHLQTLKQKIEVEMAAYRLYNVVPALFHFMEDLTNWYIRLNRNRFWGEGVSEDKEAAYSTLFIALKELTLSMAPFAPFTAEYIYKELKAFDREKSPESVHLCDYPLFNSSLQNPSLESAVEKLQQIILLGRQKRVQEKIKVKTPLKNLTVIHRDKEILEGIAKLEDYVKGELNLKEVSYETDEDKFIHLYAKPNSPVLGKKLGKDFGKFRKLIEALTPKELNLLEERGSLVLEGQEFLAEEILVFREARDGSNALSNRYISIDLDTELNEELLQEGLAREIINRIQRTRKEINLNVDDRILILYRGDQEIERTMEKFSKLIASETLANEITQNSSTKENFFNYEVEGQNLEIALQLSKV